jgi:hypothetical protein
MPDLQSYYNTPELTGAAREAETAGTTAVNYQSAAGLLPQKLREAVMAKVDYNKDIITQQNKAQAEYFAAPSAARAEYVDPESSNYIFNPFQAEALVAQKRSLAYQPFANLTDILGQRLGTLGDIIQNGVGAFQSDVAAKQGAYEMARNKYNDLLQKAQSLMQAASEEEQLKLKREQMEGDWEMDKAKLKLSGSGSGSDSGLPGVSKIDLATADRWADILEEAEGDMEEVKKIIKRDEGAMRMAGINVDALIKWANPPQSTDTEAPSNLWKAITSLFSGEKSPAPASTASAEDLGLDKYNIGGINLNK